MQLARLAYAFEQPCLCSALEPNGDAVQVASCCMVPFLLLAHDKAAEVRVRWLLLSMLLGARCMQQSNHKRG